MGRKTTRENAMKLLYQIQIQKEEPKQQVDLFLEENLEITNENREYLLDVVLGVIDRKDEIDSMIERHSKSWSVNRLPKVDLAIMRLSIYEMFFRKDIPVNVSINEAVELAKGYSTDQSSAFINGVLGKIVKERMEN